MSNRLSFLWWALLFAAFFSCTNLKVNKESFNFSGELRVFHYNSMPQINKPYANGTPLSTTVYIYEPTKITQLDSLNGSYCKKNNARLVAKIQSNTLGNFNTFLKPGKYSVFVAYENALFVPFFSGANWASLIEIKPLGTCNLKINVMGNSNSQ